VVNRERIRDELLRLLHIDSESKHESKLAAYVRRELERIPGRAGGLRVEEDSAGRAFGGDCGNLIARLEGTVQGPALLFNAHLDTVAPGKGVKPHLEKGVLRAEGATVLGSDDKAGIAALLEGLRIVVQQKLPHPPLEFVFTVSEEIGLLGAKQLDTSRLQARLGFVFDGSGRVGGVVVAAPAQDAVGAAIMGRAAHAGVEPEKGVSAIQIAARAIASMRLGRIDEETTANIGAIHGGSAMNIVPDRVELVGEARSRNEEKLKAQTRRMCEEFQKAASELGGEVRIETERLYDAYTVGKDEPVMQILSAAMQRIGVKPEHRVTGGGSDSNIFNARGIRTVVVSVGYEAVHTPGESISLAQLEKAALLAAALMSQGAS
jgi:tripeptide aminopeptidase